MLKKLLILICAFSTLFGGFLPQTVLAATPVVVVKDPGFAAKLTAQSTPDPIAISAGTSKTITFTFKNTGTKTWTSTNYISAYTMEPRERKSVFFASDWITPKQTGKIPGTVKPGQSGKLTVTFKVPSTQKPGEYVEKFYLAAENASWVKNGYFFVKIKVTAPAKTSTTPPVTKPVEQPESTANRVFLSPKKITVNGGEATLIRLGYQNIGSAAWSGVKVESTANYNFSDVTWINRQTALDKTIAIDKNSFWRDEFVLRAPAKAGEYEAHLKVSFVGTDPTTALITIPISVSADAPSGYSEPFANAAPVYTFYDETPRLAAEPNIRVGLWKDPAGGVVKISLGDDDYTVVGATGVLGTVTRGLPVTLSFKNGLYTLESDLLVVTSTDFILVKPSADPHAVSTITNFVRKVTTKSTKNFNQYRGALELRQAQDQNNSLYLINDLNFEDYMSGIGENSNASPVEYLKAQAVAQRTYAYYIQTTGKHESRNFDVVANTGDQLYLGASNEAAMPRFIDAVNATRGLMVTYNNEVVITPYFGNSDGATRSWAQVWGGNKPWLVSVPATYDERDNKKMFGHGVGMSQRDAAIRADEEGLDWVQLIRYYYTGVDLHKIY